MNKTVYINDRVQQYLPLGQTRYEERGEKFLNRICMTGDKKEFPT